MLFTWEPRVATVSDIDILCRAAIGSAYGLSSFILNNQRGALQAIYLQQMSSYPGTPLLSLTVRVQRCIVHENDFRAQTLPVSFELTSFFSLHIHISLEFRLRITGLISFLLDHVSLTDGVVGGDGSLERRYEDETKIPGL